MIDQSKIPEKGIVYALYKDRDIVFKKYASIDEIDFSEENLLEFHCFDAKKEYRYIDGKEILVMDQKEDEIYEEEVVTLYQKDGSLDSIDQRDQLDQRLKVNVVNYIHYDENDMIRIKNYRLKEVE